MTTLTKTAASAVPTSAVRRDTTQPVSNAPTKHFSLKCGVGLYPTFHFLLLLSLLAVLVVCLPRGEAAEANQEQMPKYFKKIRNERSRPPVKQLERKIKNEISIGMTMTEVQTVLGVPEEAMPNFKYVNNVKTIDGVRWIYYFYTDEIMYGGEMRREAGEYSDDDKIVISFDKDNRVSEIKRRTARYLDPSWRNEEKNVKPYVYDENFQEKVANAKSRLKIGMKSHEIICELGTPSVSTRSELVSGALWWRTWGSRIEYHGMRNGVKVILVFKLESKKGIVEISEYEEKNAEPYVPDSILQDRITKAKSKLRIGMRGEDVLRELGTPNKKTIWGPASKTTREILGYEWEYYRMKNGAICFLSFKVNHDGVIVGIRDFSYYNPKEKSEKKYSTKPYRKQFVYPYSVNAERRNMLLNGVAKFSKDMKVDDVLKEMGEPDVIRERRNSTGEVVWGYDFIYYLRSEADEKASYYERNDWKIVISITDRGIVSEIKNIDSEIWPPL